MIKSIKKLFRLHRTSLKLAMLYAVVFGIILAVLMFAAVKFGGNAIIENVYMSKDQVADREEAHLNELQKYIDENALTAENTAELLKWAQGNRDLFFMVYTIDNELVFDSDEQPEPQAPEGETPSEGEEPLPGEGDIPAEGDAPEEGEVVEDEKKDEEEDNKFPEFITVRKPTREEKIDYAERNGAKHINMSDGDVMMVYMADLSEYTYYDLVNIGAIVLALVTLILVIMLYFTEMTRRIRRLSGEVNSVAVENMEHKIRPDGEDEIGRLSVNVENMRTSMLRTLASEREAMDANSELITAMSHDIRTPLTVLLGYIDLMKLNANDETMQEYLDATEKTALKLKTMSDDMFNYFLLFGGAETEIVATEYEAETLTEQLLMEHILLLRERGYNLQYTSCDMEGVRIVTDAPHLMRIVDNLFSNITKYADKSAPVLISVEATEGKLLFTFANKIDREGNHAESNGIGLKTCRKIAELLGSSLDIKEEEETFSASFALSCVVEEKDD